MAKVMMGVFTLLLLTLCITATTTNSSRRPYRTRGQHRQGVDTNFSIRRDPASRQHVGWTTTNNKLQPSQLTTTNSTTTTRTRTASKEHGLWSEGLVSDPGLLDKHETYSSSIHQEGEGSSEPVRDCPSGCNCVLRTYLFLDYPYKGLLVKGCRSDPIDDLPELFSSHSDIAILVLNSCLLSGLPEEISKLQSLIACYLIKNEFTELPVQLQNLTKLQGLFIEDNTADVIRLENIAKLPDLKWLSLPRNKIEALPREIGRMRSLIGLNVSGNQIQSLPRVRGWGFKQLENLDLSYNRIRALNLPQICRYGSHGSFQFMNLSNNMIRTIEPIPTSLSQCFSREAVIDLSNNRISTLDSWPLSLVIKKSIHFDLSGNMLSMFTNAAGPFLPTFRLGATFQLQQNQIRHFMDIFDGWDIVVNTTQDLNTLLTNIYFELVGNPLVCDCVDYEVYRYIQTFGTDQYNNLVCHEPLSLRGQNPKQIPLGKFLCQIDENCPKGCTCLKVPNSQSINVTCGSYNHKDIPEMVPDFPGYVYRIDIQNRRLREITSRQYLQKATEIILSNNNISAIKINSTKAFKMVKILKLDHNGLQRLPESVAGIVNESAVEIRLGHNPWVCDCNAMGMKKWIIYNSHIVKDSDAILCHSPEYMVGVKVKNIKASMVCHVGENMTGVYVVAVISLVVLIFIVYLYSADNLEEARWELVGNDECEGEPHKEFDIFMCASTADSKYVEHFLIPQLEKRNYRVLYHVTHFDRTKPIHVNMSEAIHKSKRTMVFFSNKFKASHYSMFEFRTANELDNHNKTRRLITIKDTSLDMSRLDKYEINYFKKHIHVKREDVKFWKLLEYLLPKNRLGPQVRH